MAVTRGSDRHLELPAWLGTQPIIGADPISRHRLTGNLGKWGLGYSSQKCACLACRQACSSDGLARLGFEETVGGSSLMCVVRMRERIR